MLNFNEFPVVTGNPICLFSNETWNWLPRIVMPTEFGRLSRVSVLLGSLKISVKKSNLGTSLVAQ